MYELRTSVTKYKLDMQLYGNWSSNTTKVTILELDTFPGFPHL